MTSPIGVSTFLKEAECEMREMASVWYQLGLQLEIKTSILDQFEKNHTNDVRRCMTDVLIWWCRNTQEPSWRKLANAVELTGGYGNLVRRLSKKVTSGEKHTSLHNLVQVMRPSVNQNLTFCRVCLFSSYR